MMNGRVENLGAFAVAVKEAIEVVYPDNQVTINEVTKNNGVSYTGVVIKASDVNIAPTIYLDQMYEEYCDGATLGELVIRLLESMRRIAFIKILILVVLLILIRLMIECA